MTSITDSTALDQPDAGALAATFVDLARSVIEGKDMVEVFSMLAERCVQLLPVAACGLLVVDTRGDLQVIGASSHAAHLLDLFQVQNEEGPCLQCCRTGVAVVDVDLAADGPWPRFAALTLEHGFRAVYALPLAARGVAVGALNLFAGAPIGAGPVAIAQALADAATIALLQADPREDVVVLTRQLHVVVETRNTIEQAKGVVAQRFDIDADEAFARLRGAAVRTDMRLVEVAAAVVARDPANAAARLLERPPA